MRILYDGSIYYLNSVGGISRYFANLIKRLPENFVPSLTICQHPKINEPYHHNLKTHFYPRFGFHPGRVSYWLEKYYFRFINSVNHFDILHPTYYEILTRQTFSDIRVPIVLSVWDMIHEIYPKQMDPNGHTAKAKEKAIQTAQAIICISENTKIDLLERYRLPEEKVFVTHLATEMDVDISYGPEAVPAKPYFLYVGYRDHYKNFSTLLNAFVVASDKCKDIVLSVVGPPFTDSEFKKIRDLGIEKQIEIYNHISDSHLAKLYRCSTAFVYPSLYEGFGIPLLEAMSCGAPVIAANSSSIPEVVGDAALLFNPTSIEELAYLMNLLLNSNSIQEQYIQKGYERVKLFSWNKTSEQTLKVYNLVAG